MEMKTNWIEMSDGQRVHLQQWSTPSIEPKAIVQIAHGMAEHIDRYDLFAQFLVKNGIFVYGNDHRGHGKTGENQKLMGYFSDHQGFEQVTDDLETITNLIKKEYPNTPIYLFGHSMGSFLARRYIQRSSEKIDGVILSGTGYYSIFVTTFAKLLASWEMGRKGKTSPSPFLNKLSFGSFNKKMKDAETDFDWLTRDKQVVNNYINDPYTGFIPTTTFFYDLFTGLQLIHDDQLIAKIKEQLPILFITGDQDPVGNKTLGVQKVIKQYRKHDLHSIESFVYKEGRHELLNETNKHDIYKDIYNWISQNVKKNRGNF